MTVLSLYLIFHRVLASLPFTQTCTHNKGTVMILFLLKMTLQTDYTSKREREREREREGGGEKERKIDLI